MDRYIGIDYGSATASDHIPYASFGIKNCQLETGACFRIQVADVHFFFCQLLTK